MTPGRAALDRAEIQTLLLMSQVHQRAKGEVAETVAREPDQPSPTTGRPAAHTAEGVAGPYLDEARLLLSEQNSVGPTRFRLAKRVVLRGSRLFTHRLVSADQHLADAIQSVETAHGAAIAADRNEFQQLTNNLNAQLTSIELAGREPVERLADDLRSTEARLAGLAESIQALHTALAARDQRIAALEGAADYDRSELRRLRSLVYRLGRDRVPAGATAADAAALPGGSQPAATTGPGSAPSTIDERTYADFEMAFRGTPDEIRARQQDALELVADLRGAEAPLLDLGCGRGEWLGLLRSAGIPGYGVDSSAAMVEIAADAGVDARLGDALEHLAGLPESSLQGVSAFHFAEHIPTAALVKLLDDALLALRPGGLLLLETPNPTNLVVGAASFYLDPTHLRPIHPDFLAFLAESRGFTHARIHFVHPAAGYQSGEGGAAVPGSESRPQCSRLARDAEWALHGPQDYVLTARRPEVAL